MITISTGSVQQAVRGINRSLDASLEKILLATGQAITEIANDVNADAQARINNRSGDLSRSATVEEIIVTADQISVRFGFNSLHGRQTDQGGPILPKRGRMLAIPLDPILTGRGVSRYPSPLAEPGLFLLKLWGKLFLAKKMGKQDASIQLHWLLTPKVEQPGTRFFTGAVRQATPDIPRRIAERVSSLLPAGGNS
jgi:hypothetical protein